MHDRQNGMCVRCRMSPRDGFGPLFIKIRGQCRCDMSRRLAAFDRTMGLPPGSSRYGWLNWLHVVLGFSLSTLVALAQLLCWLHLGDRR